MSVERLPASRGGFPLATFALLGALAVYAGVAIGDQNNALLIPLGGAVALGLFLAATAWPTVGFWVLLCATVTLPFIPVTEHRGVNPVDLFLLPTLLGAWWARDRSLDVLPPAVARARRRFVTATLLFFGAGLLSLVMLAVRGHLAWAEDSFLLLARAFMGVIFFKLVEWMVKTRRDLWIVSTAVVVGFVISMAVNAVGMLLLHVPRAGAAWNLANLEYFIQSPNEAGFSVVFVWALLIAFPRNRLWTAFLMASSLLFLAATGSRSGFVAWATFVVVWAVRTKRARLLLLPPILLAFYPLFPEGWRDRFVRTILFQRGTFEVYSTLVRFYAMRTGINMFLHSPLFGVGYVSFRFFSREYNTLTLNLGTTENYFVETACGMGLVGLAALAYWTSALVRLVARVRAIAPPRSVALRLAEISVPLLVAEFVANLTGCNLTGMVCLSQVAVVCALLTSAARLEAHDQGLVTPGAASPA